MACSPSASLGPPCSCPRRSRAAPPPGPPPLPGGRSVGASQPITAPVRNGLFAFGFFGAALSLLLALAAHAPRPRPRRSGLIAPARLLHPGGGVSARFS